LLTKFVVLPLTGIHRKIEKSNSMKDVKKIWVHLCAPASGQCSGSALVSMRVRIQIQGLMTHDLKKYTVQVKKLMFFDKKNAIYFSLRPP
jgi:hypothetical protein